jgi:outer membrane protein OmpA-like peptidoglycan-associated protein
MLNTNSYRATAGARGRTALLALALASAACASANRKEKGAVIGTVAGATVGGVIGNNTGSTARGAIIGAVVGGTAGAIIGHQMDQQAKELKFEIPGSVVERVGEGIQVTFASGILYDFDSDVIRPEAGLNLETLARSLKKYPTTQLLIVGHTDALGTTAYNQDLSARRASSAARYLVTQGVPASRTQTSGKGESEPLAANGTESGRQLNRRIEVAIFTGETTRTAGR